MIRGYFYRLIMRIAHHYNWHYAPPIYPDGDTQLWCKWCGFRAAIKRAGTSDLKYNEHPLDYVQDGGKQC